MTSYLAEKWKNAKAGMVLVATLGMPAALGMAAHDLAVTRYVERHLRHPATNAAALRAGDLVAVTGRVSGKPVYLPQALPQFRDAMMVVQQFEHRRKGRWREDDREIWVSDSITLAGWALTPDLIEHAQFDWHLSSDCTGYVAPAGWTVKCPYVVKGEDARRRFSYRITPLNDQIYTLIAQVSDSLRTLDSIQHPLSRGRDDLAVLAHGSLEPQELIGDALKKGVAGMVLSSLGLVTVAYGWMYALIGGGFGGFRRVWGAFWRGIIVAAPFAGFYADIQSNLFIPIGFGAMAAAFGLALFFWYRVDKAAKDKSAVAPGQIPTTDAR